MARTLRLTDEQHALLVALLDHAAETEDRVQFVEAIWEETNDEQGEDAADAETDKLWEQIAELDQLLLAAPTE